MIPPSRQAKLGVSARLRSTDYRTVPSSRVRSNVRRGHLPLNSNRQMHDVVVVEPGLWRDEADGSDRGARGHGDGLDGPASRCLIRHEGVFSGRGGGPERKRVAEEDR
jgi:hypothetical protein